ncbi:MAG: hypothetical protein ACK41P_01540 [Asticcacaulis sp.]
MKRATGFLVLLALSLAAGYGFLWQANAPLDSLDQIAWMDWARLSPDMAGLVVFCALVALISVVGAFARMMSPAKADAPIYTVVPAQAPALSVSNPSPIPTPARSSVRPAAADRPELRSATLAPTPVATDDEFDVPSLSSLSSDVKTVSAPDALTTAPDSTLAPQALVEQTEIPLAPALPTVSPPHSTTAEVTLETIEAPEPQGATILQFVSPRTVETEDAPASTPPFSTDQASLSEADGPFCAMPETVPPLNTDVQALLEALPITALEPDPEASPVAYSAPPPVTSESPIPAATTLTEPPAGIAPEIARALLGLDEPETLKEAPPAVTAPSEAEELAALDELRALIAEDIMSTGEPVTAAPVAETPEPTAEDTFAVEAPVEMAMAETTPVAQEVPEVSSPVIAAPMAAPTDLERETYEQAMAQTLAHWPEAARADMQDTLAPRLAHLTKTEDPALQGAAALLAAGQLAPALAQIRSRAERLAATGRQPEAAEAYRTLATLYLGRDDAAALDGFALSVQNNPYDGRSLSYLARRHAALGQFDRAEHYGRMLLAAPDSTAEQLTVLPMLGDLALKRGATEEACGYFADYQTLAEQQATAEADNLQLRSSLALSYARLAQIQEMRGARDQAVQLYGRAHGLFDQLASAVPGHAGLASMRDTAARDLQRLGA